VVGEVVDAIAWSSRGAGTVTARGRRVRKVRKQEGRLSLLWQVDMK